MPDTRILSAAAFPIPKYVATVSQPVSPCAANTSGMMARCRSTVALISITARPRIVIPSLQRLKLEYHLGNISEVEEQIYQCRLQPQELSLPSALPLVEQS